MEECDTAARKSVQPKSPLYSSTVQNNSMLALTHTDVLTSIKLKM